MFSKSPERLPGAPQRRIEKLGRRAYLLADTLFHLSDRRPLDDYEARRIGCGVLAVGTLLATFTLTLGLNSHDPGVQKQDSQDMFCGDDTVPLSPESCIEP